MINLIHQQTEYLYRLRTLIRMNRLVFVAATLLCCKNTHAQMCDCLKYSKPLVLVYNDRVLMPDVDLSKISLISKTNSSNSDTMVVKYELGRMFFDSARDTSFFNRVQKVDLMFFVFKPISEEVYVSDIPASYFKERDVPIILKVYDMSLSSNKKYFNSNKPFVYSIEQRYLDTRGQYLFIKKKFRVVRFTGL
jgi:hypothetical protein